MQNVAKGCKLTVAAFRVVGFGWLGVLGSKEANNGSDYPFAVSSLVIMRYREHRAFLEGCDANSCLWLFLFPSKFCSEIRGESELEDVF